MSEYFDDFEDHHEYDDFDDEDPFYDDEFDRDADDASEEAFLEEAGETRSGLKWYEVGLLGALADELSEEKKRRRRLKKRS